MAHWMEIADRRHCEICDRNLATEEYAIEFGEGLFVCPECWEERPEGVELLEVVNG